MGSLKRELDLESYIFSRWFDNIHSIIISSNIKMLDVMVVELLHHWSWSQRDKETWPKPWRWKSTSFTVNSIEAPDKIPFCLQFLWSLYDLLINFKDHDPDLNTKIDLQGFIFKWIKGPINLHFVQVLENAKYNGFGLIMLMMTFKNCNINLQQIEIIPFRQD